MAARAPLALELITDRARTTELRAMKKQDLVALVVELEARTEKLEEDNDMLEERAKRETREAVFHERLCEMGLASGPLRLQSPEYRADLARAMRRA